MSWALPVHADRPAVSCSDRVASYGTPVSTPALTLAFTYYDTTFIPWLPQLFWTPCEVLNSLVYLGEAKKYDVLVIGGVGTVGVAFFILIRSLIFLTNYTARPARKAHPTSIRHGMHRTNTTETQQ